MKKLVILAALAFTLGTVHPASGDWGLHAANKAPTVVACEGNNCAMPKPETVAPKVACDNNNCDATDEPQASPLRFT
jgi:hypothetical protein